MPILIAICLFVLLILTFKIVSYCVYKNVGQVRIYESDGEYQVVQYGRVASKKYERYFGGELICYGWKYVEADGDLSSSSSWATYKSKEAAQEIADLARKNFADFLEWKKTHQNRVNDRWNLVK